MFIGCGYNFLSDGSALNAAPVNIDTYENTSIRNGIFDHLNITKDVTSPWDGIIPTEWGPETLFNADFNGKLSAGNLAYLISQISGFNVKRRKATDFNWITLAYVPIDKDNPQVFYNDNLAVTGEDYEYAVVPVIGGVEGNYINKAITTNFDGVFICDNEFIYKLYADVSYDSWKRNQSVGVFEPYGRKYPVTVSNALTNYTSGQVSGTVLPPDYLKTALLDRKAAVKERGVLLDFLTNKKAKLLKDWNGNAYLVIISDAPTISFLANSGMGFANVQFPFVEIGDSESQADLYSAGLLSEVE